MIVNGSIRYPFRIASTVTNLINATLGDAFGIFYPASKMSNWGLSALLLNSQTRCSAKGDSDTKTSIAGAIEFVYMESNTTARIENDVNINQDAAYQTNDQSVSVLSKAEAALVNIVGNYTFNLQPGLAANKKLESVKKIL